MNFSDPLGLCPWCVGFVVGAGVEAFSEWASGNGIHWKEVAAAGVIGALTGGVSALEDGVARTGFKIAAQAALSVADGEARAHLAGDGKYSATDAGKDAFIGALAGIGGEAVGKYNESGLKNYLGDKIDALEHGPQTLLSGAKGTEVTAEVRAFARRLQDIEAGLVGATTAGAGRVPDGGGD